jgi:isoaspartyl peptidase/L-asparaginase-like protein (Ntn-hydrolase superfamily)
MRLLALALLLALSSCTQCKQGRQEGPDRGPPEPRERKAAAIAHAGLSSPPDRSDGPRKAVDAALKVIEDGGDPLDAVLAGVKVLEDDPRFNAGTGSRVRIDGETVQMDASIMSSDGRFAAVAAIERVQNPVAVARAVLDTPHVMLVGDGATRFARTLGMPDYDPSTPEMRDRAKKTQQQLLTSAPELPEAWRTFDWRTHWNFEKPMDAVGLAGDPGESSDTVGVVVRTEDGRFAAALSTGGTTITLRGRVGDVPIFGAGLFASPSGASAATGDGEHIIRTALARQIDEWLASGLTAQQAADKAAALIEDRGGGVGVIVLSRTDLAVAATNHMAWAARESGSTEWHGP